MNDRDMVNNTLPQRRKADAAFDSLMTHPALGSASGQGAGGVRPQQEIAVHTP